MSTSESRSELADIRKQLQEISSLSKEEKKLSGSYGGQVSTLKRDLALLEKQVAFERERRLDLERTLDNERKDVLPEEHVATIKRREEDIRLVREEKAAMLEWLQRGVAEAQRITMQIEQLKSSYSQSQAAEAEFQDDTRRLKEMEERLQLELDETKEKIKKLGDQKESLQDHTEQQTSIIGVTADIVRSTGSDNQRIQQDLERLQSRARDVETVEIAVGCMAASVRRTVHELEKMQVAVNTGSMPEDDGYDSGEDADNTTFSPVVLSSTKAKIGRCDALLTTLWSTMKRFDQDAGSRNAAIAQKHNQQVQSMKTEYDTLKTNLTKELEELRSDADRREPMLRRFIQLRDEALKSYDELLGTPGYEHQPFDLIGYIEKETNNLRHEVQRLSEDNYHLKNRTETMEKDYKAMKELKREYRDLEAQRTMLSHSLRTAEASNKEMKFYLFESKKHGQSMSMTPRKGGSMSMSGSGMGTPRSRTPGTASAKKPAWRSPTLD